MQSDTGTDFNFKIFADYMFAYLCKRIKYIIVYKEIVRSKRVFMYILRDTETISLNIAFFLNRVQNSACPITVLWFASGIITASLHDIILYPHCPRRGCFSVIDLQVESKII